MAFSNKRVACPSCRAQGRDSTGNHLHLYEDEKAGWCHKEQKTIRLEESMDREWKPKQQLDLAVVQHYPVRALEDRGISKETAEAFDVRVSTDEVNGQIDCHYYPYHDPDGAVVGYKKRNLPKQFSVVGKVRGLFGQKNCKGGKFLLVTEGECLSGDTEIMTDGGWVRLDEYSGENVLAVREDFSASFEQPIAYIKKPYDGDMWQYVNPQVDFCATPKHNMVVRDHTNLEYHNKPLDECGASQRIIPKVCLHDGEGISLTDSQIALGLACSADGYFREIKQNGPIRKKGQFYAKIGVRKERKQSRIERLFKETGTPYKKYLSKRMPEYVFTLPDYCTGRILPIEWITKSTLRQKMFMIEELAEWDGNRVLNRNQYEFNSIHIENAEWVQMLAVMCGYSATIIRRHNTYGEWFKVSILKGKKTASFQPKKMVRERSLDGFVYCVQTTTGRILVRRNEKVMVIGNCDAMSAYQMLREQGKNYNVVSLPNGASEPDKHGNVSIDAATLREIEWITQYGSIALCLDQDAVGQAYAQALAEMLASQCKVAIIKLPMKDANDMLRAGRGKEFLKALFDAKPYHPEAIVEGKDVSLEDLMTPKEPGIELPYPKLQKMTWGLRKGEITLVTAGSGLGKSTFVREIGYDLVNKGYRIAYIALETVMEDVARSFIAMDNNIPVYTLMFKPDCIPHKDYERSYNQLIKSNAVNFFKHWGSIHSDTLLRKCQYYVKALGVDFILLDHVSMVVAGNESENERKDIDRLFENMTRLVVETGVGVIPVMHLKRVAGKSFNKGDEVELTDLRGSAGAEQMSWNVWALERNQQGEQKDIVNLRVLKNRLLGFTGLADTLIYSHETGRLQLFQAEF